MAQFGDISNNINLSVNQSIRRNSDDSLFEAYTPVSDVSISDIWTKFGYVDTSLLNLGIKDANQDVSLNSIWTKLGSVDTSLLNLGSVNAAQDASIIALRTKDGNIDTSLNAIWTKFGSVDTSLLNLGTKNANQDVSINAIWTKLDACLGSSDVNKDYVDGSLATRDSSITLLFLQQATQDASIVVLRTKDSNIDTSLNIIWAKFGSVDTSLLNLGIKDTQQDASIVALRTKDSNIDTSLNSIWTKFGSVDTSLLNLGTKNANQDTSLNNIWTTLGSVDTSLLNLGIKDVQQDASIVALRTKDGNIDTSLNNIWTKLDACLGGGSGGSDPLKYDKIGGLISGDVSVTGNIMGAGNVDISGNVIAGNVTTRQCGYFGAGTEALPSIAFYNDEDTGFWNVGPNRIGVSLSGDEKYRFTAGDFHAAGNGIFSSTTTPSDRRLKKNIKPISNSLKIVSNLQGVSFDLKSTGEKKIGLIAQDVEPFLPEVVHEYEMFDGSIYKTIDYPSIVSVLINAINEQQKQITKLKRIIHGHS